jgi:addiction module HigA family antidote
VEEFLKPLALTEYRLAKGLRVPARRINEIGHGKRAVTADTALRLGRFFRNSPRFWLICRLDSISRTRRIDSVRAHTRC